SRLWRLPPASRRHLGDLVLCRPAQIAGLVPDVGINEVSGFISVARTEPGGLLLEDALDHVLRVAVRLGLDRSTAVGWPRWAALARGSVVDRVGVLGHRLIPFIGPLKFSGRVRAHGRRDPRVTAPSGRRAQSGSTAHVSSSSSRSSASNSCAVIRSHAAVSAALASDAFAASAAALAALTAVATSLADAHAADAAAAAALAAAADASSSAAKNEAASIVPVATTPSQSVATRSHTATTGSSLVCDMASR